MPPKKKIDPLTQGVDQSQNLRVDDGGTRRSSRLQGHVPSSSENIISDCRTAVIEGSKTAANEVNPKRGRPSKKGASNRPVAADSVNESAVIGQIAKEVVVGSSRPEIREWADQKGREFHLSKQICSD
ncbi:hypothetical protein ACLB2K_062445 [Fragaria x ananassa]